MLSDAADAHAGLGVAVPGEGAGVEGDRERRVDAVRPRGGDDPIDESAREEHHENDECPARHSYPPCETSSAAWVIRDGGARQYCIRCAPKFRNNCDRVHRRARWLRRATLRLRRAEPTNGAAGEKPGRPRPLEIEAADAA